MTHILHIGSSPTAPHLSALGRLSDAVVNRPRELHSDAQVIVRDLATSPPLYIDETILSSWSVTANRRTPEQVATVTRRVGLIAKLRVADLIVIGAPLHNFSLPSVLTAWIDYVLIAGQPFATLPRACLKESALTSHSRVGASTAKDHSRPSTIRSRFYAPRSAASGSPLSKSCESKDWRWGRTQPPPVARGLAAIDALATTASVAA